MSTGSVDAQNSWNEYITSSSDATIAVSSMGAGENVLQMTSSTTGGAAYAYKSVSFANRTSGNDLIFSSFSFNTGASSTSTGTFTFDLEDVTYKTLIGYDYQIDTKVLRALIFDSVEVNNNGVYFVKLGASGADLVLDENTTYNMIFGYDVANGEASFYVLDNAGTSMVGYNSTTFSTTRQVSELNIYNYDANNSTSVATVWYDDINVIARPCLLYGTKDDVAFSYTPSSICNTASNVSPVLNDNAVTGTFTSTPAGLSIDATSGLITTSTSTAGTYTVQFASNVAQTSDDSSTVSITINDCSGLPEHYSSSFSVSPNPANQFVNVTLADNVFEGTIRLITSEGKEVEVREVSANRTETFNVSNLERGIYFIQLGDKIEKVVVQ